MNEQIKERIEIAEGFNTIYKWEKHEEKAKWLKIVAYVELGLATVTLLFTIFFSLLTICQMERFIHKWENSGLIVFMAMSFSLRAPMAYISVILKKHIEKLQRTELSIDSKLNAELGQLLKRLNRRNLNFMAVPVGIILVAAFMQVIELNPYWGYFPLLVLAVCLVILVQINYGIIMVKKNIKKTENV